MLDVCLLGTSGMMPLPRRALTALMTRFNGSSLLIDCGEGTQVSIREKGFSMHAIDTICLTHVHGDHVSGLPGLLLSMGNAERTERLTIIGPKGMKKVVESLLVVAPGLPFEIEYIELTESFHRFEICGYILEAFRVKHTVPCYGYSQIIQRAGRFDSEKAKANDVPMKVWSSLQKGKTVDWEGKTYTPDMVLGPAEDDAFAAEIERRYTAPSIDNRSEVRWWMAEAGHTDETIRAEIQAMYDGGFRGVELCAQGEDEISEADYGYGSAQWDHDLKLAMNTALDLGMTVSLTSGTNWATANVPGLDPHSQGASQIVVDIVEYIKAGASRSGAIPLQKKVGSKVYPIEPTAKLIGVFAVPQTSGNKAKPIVTDGTGIIELTDKLVWEADGTITLDWTPENAESKYRLFYYWQQGAMQESHPAAETAYCINYFDEAGVKALKEYWLSHILDDEALNAKIQAGDVQLFMDSLEISTEYGCAFWCDDMAEEFLARKGYDIRPYLYLTIGLPELFYWDAVDYGSYDLADKAMREKVLNDLFDVQTQLYRERMLEPLRAWLHEYGIKTRAQISYGQRLEISEPIMSVDYPEAEILNQNNQVDMYRLWTGGAKLQNKVLSSETGAYGGYAYTEQDHLMEAYNLFAAGFNRIVWHIWSAQYGPGTDNRWPHYTASGAVYASFYAFGPHEPSSVDYPSFNDHLGRICQLLREGVSRTDVGMIYMNYQQPMPTSGNHGGENWLLDHTTGFFPSTTLQDNGYTYDYFSPDFLTADGVYYNAETGTLEQAGYQAIVLWHEQLALDGAKALLDLAKQGMKVVVVDGAAVQTPYNDGGEAALADVMAEMKALPNVYSAKDADDAARVLQSAGVNVT